MDSAPSRSTQALAERVAAEVQERWENGAGSLNLAMVPPIASALEAAIREAELRGLERAATICAARATNAFQGREAAKCAAKIRDAIKEVDRG